jgi:hypothetical protein
MEKTAETFTLNNLDRNVEECITLDVRGLPYSIYQKRTLEEKAGG